MNRLAFSPGDRVYFRHNGILGTELDVRVPGTPRYDASPRSWGHRFWACTIAEVVRVEIDEFNACGEPVTSVLVKVSSPCGFIGEPAGWVSPDDIARVKEDRDDRGRSP